MTGLDGWGVDARMSELEATMWRGDKHPVNSTQGGVLDVLAGTPAWEDVVRLHESALARYPRFRQRVVAPALPVGPPVWVVDEQFDLQYHLRRVRLPAPGDRRQLLELTQALQNTPLDRSRPPWTATFIEGLEGGRSAYFAVVQHCLMDGQALVQLLNDLHHRRPDGVAAGRPSVSASRRDGAVGVAVQHALSGVRNLPERSRALAGDLAGTVAAGPLRGARFARSLGRVLAPPPVRSTALLRGATRARWRHLVLDVPLDELRAAARAADASVNDAYVAAILGGLRRHHERRSAAIDDITVAMPVSVRREGEAGGNRFAAAFVSGPAGEPDPARRIAELRAQVRRARAEPALDVFSLVLPLVNRAPTPVLRTLFTAMQDRADLTVSNVPGPPEPVRFGGPAVDELVFFGALAGSPITTVLCSHAGRCTIGVTCDGGAFPDLATLEQDLRDGLAEVVALGAA